MPGPSASPVHRTHKTGHFTSYELRTHHELTTDINAETSLASTRFQLDLPAAKDADLAVGLSWLRNIADGMTFDTAGVDKERGVVLAEMETRKTPQSLADEAVTRFQASGVRSTNREPIGTEASLRAATPEAVKAFYDRWYRPDQAVVVMVGDLPLDVLEAKVRATFETWRSLGPPPLKAPRAPPDPGRGLDAAAFDQTALLNTVTACRLGPSTQTARDDMARTRREALGHIWREILNQRLADLRNIAANNLLGSRMEIEDNGLDLRGTCLVVLPITGGWATSLAAAQKELRRFSNSGPTELELDKAIDAARSQLRGAITAAPNRTNGELADSVLDLVLSGRVLAEPRQALRAYDIAVENLSVADVRATFAEDWRGAGPVISIVSPSPPTSEAIRAAWLDVEGGNGLASYADRKDSDWGYDFGRPGVVAVRQTDGGGQFVRIQFRNGVRLNFKQTTFAANSVNLAIRFGDGRRAIESRQYLVAALGGAVAGFGGDGKHSFDDLRRMFPDDSVQLKILIGDDAFTIDREVTRPNLPDALKILAAYMSDPGFRPTVDPVVQAGLDVAYRLARSTPRGSISTAMMESVAPGSPLTLPPRSSLDGVNSVMLAGILKPEILADPIELTLVGDIDEKTAISLIAATFGALAPRPAAARSRTDTFYLRFPATPPPLIRTTHDGPADKAAAQVVWPLYVSAPSRRREGYAVGLVGAIFADELRRRVREDLAKSYDPTVEADIKDGGDQGDLSAMVESYPADAEAMLTEIRAVARRLKDGGVTAEQLEAARAPILALDRQRLATNDWWARALSQVSRRESALRDMLDYNAVVSSLTLDEVRKAAADWLTSEPVMAVSMPATPRPEARP